MKNTEADLKKVYDEYSDIMTKVENTPFFKERGTYTRVRIDLLETIKVFSIDYENKMLRAIIFLRKEKSLRIDTLNDLINIDYMMFFTIQEMGGETIRKAKLKIRDHILNCFVAKRVTINQTKKLHVPRKLYDIKKDRERGEVLE